MWAGGDCVEVHHRLSHQGVAIALGTHANKHGRIIGTNLAGGYGAFPGVIGTAISKVCSLEIGRTGLGEAEARAAGYGYVTTTIESTNVAGYFPGAETMTVKVLAEQRTGTLLGAQIVGRADSAKRIDVFATAIWHSMDVEEMTFMDLSYAPPFSPVWDAVPGGRPQGGEGRPGGRAGLAGVGGRSATYPTWTAGRRDGSGSASRSTSRVTGATSPTPKSR